jgi:hypothetical protein
VSVPRTPLRQAVPFIVYAMDAPSYPAGEVLGYDPSPVCSRSRYGASRRARLLHGLRQRKQEMTEIPGSLIIISGGYYWQDHLEDGLAARQPEILMYGCLDMENGWGNRFAEQAISSIVKPDDRVVVLLHVSRGEASRNLDKVRESGLEVIETGDVTPGVDSAYALCLGRGKMLQSYEWLGHVWGYEPFFLNANRGSRSSLESVAGGAALKRTDPESAVVRLLEGVQRAPEAAREALGENYVHVGLIDPDGRSLLIMREDPDISGLGPLFSRVAQEIGVALFDAGSLRQPDGQGNYFTEFRYWDRYAPMPKHWRRIV